MIGLTNIYSKSRRWKTLKTPFLTYSMMIMYSDWTRFWGNKSTKQLPNLTLWWRMYDWWTRPDQIQMSWTSNLITTATCDRRNYKCLDVVLAHQLATRHCNRIHLTQQEQKVSRTKAILLPGFDYLKQKHFLAFQFNNTLYFTCSLKIL